MNVYIYLLIAIIIIYIVYKFKYIETMESNYSYIVNYNGQQITSTQYVEQGIAAVSYDKLYTNGVGTCCVITFRINNKNFLSHVDAYTSEQYIINTINKHFNKELNTHFSIYLYKGSWCEDCSSVSIVKNALKKLNIYNKLIDKGIIKHSNTIIINKNGKVYIK